MRCGRCREVKGLDQFTPGVVKRGNGKCKPCAQEYRALQRERDPERYKAYALKWYRNNREQAARANAAWERRNRERKSRTQRERRQRTGEKFEWDLQKRYGLSAGKYARLLSAQGGGCAICGVRSNPNGTRLAVDHCHITGRVRGILCRKCNTGVGQLGDKPQRLRAAVAYLEKSTPPVGYSMGLVH